MFASRRFPGNVTAMFRLLTFLFALLTLPALAVDVPFSVAVAQKQLRAEFTGNGRDTVTLKLANLTKEKLPVVVPAGLVLAGENGERQLLLRALTMELSANEEKDSILPAAALSTKNSDTQRLLKPAAEREPRLEKLIALFEKQNDLPRPTAQLAVFIMLEDLKFADWQKWLAPTWAHEKPPKQHPTPAEIAQAVDALAFAKLAAPERKPALLADGDLKRLALRNPWARGKAMVLYGLTVDDAVTGDPSLPPDLGTLLHTSPNDNCPICRQRAKMQPEIP